MDQPLDRAHLALLAFAACVLTAVSLTTASLARSADPRTVLFLTLGLGQLGVAAALGTWGRRTRQHLGLPVSLLLAAALMLVALAAPLTSLLGTAPGASADLLVVLGGVLVSTGLVVLWRTFFLRGSREMRGRLETTGRPSPRR